MLIRPSTVMLCTAFLLCCALIGVSVTVMRVLVRRELATFIPDEDGGEGGEEDWEELVAGWIVDAALTLTERQMDNSSVLMLNQNSVRDEKHADRDNICGIDFSPLVCQEPIDAVYTWVNGSDSHHKQQVKVWQRRVAMENRTLRRELIRELLWRQFVRNASAADKEETQRDGHSETTSGDSHSLPFHSDSPRGEVSAASALISSIFGKASRIAPHLDESRGGAPAIDHRHQASQLPPSFTSVDQSLLADLVALGGDSVVHRQQAADQASASRFADHDELRYSLRSLQTYGGWVRHVYLVTNGQVPTWLNFSHPKITVITHEQIFINKDSRELPTFSSNAIEANLHRIPNLSKRFLYFNDDTFFAAPVSLEDFYSPTRGHRIYESWQVPSCAPGCPPQWLGDGQCDNSCNVPECEYDLGDCPIPQQSAPPAEDGAGSFPNIASVQPAAFVKELLKRTTEQEEAESSGNDAKIVLTFQQLLLRALDEKRVPQIESNLSKYCHITFMDRVDHSLPHSTSDHSIDTASKIDLLSSLVDKERSCAFEHIGDGVCHPPCNTSICGFDGGDCVPDVVAVLSLAGQSDGGGNDQLGSTKIIRPVGADTIASIEMHQSFGSNNLSSFEEELVKSVFISIAHKDHQRDDAVGAAPAASQQTVPPTVDGFLSVFAAALVNDFGTRFEDVLEMLLFADEGCLSGHVVGESSPIVAPLSGGQEGNDKRSCEAAFSLVGDVCGHLSQIEAQAIAAQQAARQAAANKGKATERMKGLRESFRRFLENHSIGSGDRDGDDDDAGMLDELLRSLLRAENTTLAPNDAMKSAHTFADVSTENAPRQLVEKFTSIPFSAANDDDAFAYAPARRSTGIVLIDLSCVFPATTTPIPAFAIDEWLSQKKQQEGEDNRTTVENTSEVIEKGAAAELHRNDTVSVHVSFVTSIALWAEHFGAPDENKPTDADDGRSNRELPNHSPLIAASSFDEVGRSLQLFLNLREVRRLRSEGVADAIARHLSHLQSATERESFLSVPSPSQSELGQDHKEDVWLMPSMLSVDFSNNELNASLSMLGDFMSTLPSDLQRRYGAERLGNLEAIATIHVSVEGSQLSFDANDDAEGSSSPHDALPSYMLKTVNLTIELSGQDLLLSDLSLQTLLACHRKWLEMTQQRRTTVMTSAERDGDHEAIGPRRRMLSETEESSEVHRPRRKSSFAVKAPFIASSSKKKGWQHDGDGSSSNSGFAFSSSFAHTALPTTTTRRRLTDLFGDSLLHTNMLLTQQFGALPRRVPAHMVHLIDTEAAGDLWRLFGDAMAKTSASRFRSQENVQFALAHFYYIAHATQTRNFSDFIREEVLISSEKPSPSAWLIPPAVVDVKSGGAREPTLRTAEDFRRLALLLWEENLVDPKVYDKVSNNRILSKLMKQKMPAGEPAYLERLQAKERNEILMQQLVHDTEMEWVMQSYESLACKREAEAVSATLTTASATNATSTSQQKDNSTEPLFIFPSSRFMTVEEMHTVGPWSIADDARQRGGKGKWCADHHRFSPPITSNQTLVEQAFVSRILLRDNNAKSNACVRGELSLISCPFGDMPTQSTITVTADTSVTASNGNKPSAQHHPIAPFSTSAYNVEHVVSLMVRRAFGSLVLKLERKFETDADSLKKGEKQRRDDVKQLLLETILYCERRFYDLDIPTQSQESTNSSTKEEVRTDVHDRKDPPAPLLLHRSWQHFVNETLSRQFGFLRMYKSFDSSGAFVDMSSVFGGAIPSYASTRDREKDDSLPMSDAFFGRFLWLAHVASLRRGLVQHNASHLDSLETGFGDDKQPRQPRSSAAAHHHLSPSDAFIDDQLEGALRDLRDMIAGLGPIVVPTYNSDGAAPISNSPPGHAPIVGFQRLRHLASSISHSLCNGRKGKGQAATAASDLNRSNCSAIEESLLLLFYLQYAHFTPLFTVPIAKEKQLSAHLYTNEVYLPTTLSLLLDALLPREAGTCDEAESTTDAQAKTSVSVIVRSAYERGLLSVLFTLNKEVKRFDERVATLKAAAIAKAREEAGGVAAEKPTERVRSLREIAAENAKMAQLNRMQGGRRHVTTPLMATTPAPTPQSNAFGGNAAADGAGEKDYDSFFLHDETNKRWHVINSLLDDVRLFILVENEDQSNGSTHHGADFLDEKGLSKRLSSALFKTRSETLAATLLSSAWPVPPPLTSSQLENSLLGAVTIGTSEANSGSKDADGDEEEGRATASRPLFPKGQSQLPKTALAKHYLRNPNPKKPFLYDIQKYSSETISVDSPESGVTFAMIRNNLTVIRDQLDHIRTKRPKFLCINDDMDHAAFDHVDGGASDAASIGDRREEHIKVIAALKDLFEGYFPTPSVFERQDGLRNEFTRLSTAELVKIDAGKRQEPPRQQLENESPNGPPASQKTTSAPSRPHRQSGASNGGRLLLDKKAASERLIQRILAGVLVAIVGSVGAAIFALKLFAMRAKKEQ